MVSRHATVVSVPLAYKFNIKKGDQVIIMDYAWLSCRTVILPGVKIGEGSVIAAGSVVTKDTDDLTALYSRSGECLGDALYITGVAGPACGHPVRGPADIVRRVVGTVLGLCKEAGGDGGRSHD